LNENQELKRRLNSHLKSAGSNDSVETLRERKTVSVRKSPMLMDSPGSINDPSFVNEIQNHILKQSRQMMAELNYERETRLTLQQQIVDSESVIETLQKEKRNHALKNGILS
jgi:translation initiation factor 2 beta subunit (eIF-2beta)/eIF-5